jgi:iron complex transport system substrate-binding protein
MDFFSNPLRISNHPSAMKRFISSVALIFLVILGIQWARSVSLNAPPQGEDLRIISLAPNLTEILFELGLGDQLVGVTSYCTHPPEALEKEKVGDFINPNLEKIVSLKPDLVVSEHWPSSKTVPRLREFGLQVTEVISPRSFEEIYQVIREIGETVNRSQGAEGLIHKMKERLEAIEAKASTLAPSPSVYVEIDLPSWTIGKQSFITEALRLCGAHSLFEDVDKRSFQASKEMIVDRNPDFILAYAVDAPAISHRPGWADIKAVKNGRIIDDLERSLFSHGNHRLIEGMEQLQARILAMMETS